VHKQSLHFSQFQRTKHSAQTGHASSVAARLAEHLADKLAAAIALPLFHNLLRLSANLVARDVGEIGLEATQQGLADIGVQLRLELRAVHILAPENPFVEHA